MIECYYNTCIHHCQDEPFCRKDNCGATEQDIEKHAAARKLVLMGYDLDELERDNPYNNYVEEE